MDCETNYQLCQILNYAQRITGDVFTLPLFFLGFLIPFWIANEIKKRLAADSHENQPRVVAQPLPPQPKPAPPLAPPAPQPKRPVELEDILTLVEVVRELRRPANCPQCGAPREPNQTKCGHCGRAL